MIPRNLLRVLALALVAVAALVACGSGGGGTASSAASVDGERFTDADVARNVKIFTFLGDLNQNACGSAKVEGETEQAACARFALASLIQEHFVDGYATENDVVVEQKDVDAIITQLEQSLGSAGALDEKLKAAGITRTDLDDLAHRILLFQAVQQAVAAEDVDEAALHELYEDSILQFTTLDTEHILVKTEEEANRIYEEASAPGFTEKDFLALAKQESTDPTAPQNSGALGPIPASQLEQPYAQAAEALRPGQISQPVESSFGWHVLRLVDKEVQSFDDTRATLEQQQGTQTFDDWLKRVVEAATVEVNPKYGRFNPDTQAVDAITSTATGSSTPSGATAPSNASAP